jgi:hypothetical protein
MDLAKLHTKLIAAARAHAPSHRVPYAFEQRVLAHLRSGQVEDSWAVWGKALWRSAFACLLIAVGLSVWSLQANGDAVHDFDSAMVSAAEPVVDSW